MADGFVSNLRMANLFPSGLSAPTPGESFGDSLRTIAPYLYTQQRDAWRHEQDMAEMAHRNRLDEIAANIHGQRSLQQPQPQNISTGITPFQDATLKLKKGELENKEAALEEKRQYGDRKLAQGDENIKMKQDLSNLHDMTDSEKLQAVQDGRLSAEDLKAHYNTVLQGLKGQQQQQAITTRGSQQRETLKQRGDQTLNQIAARASEQRETNAAKADSKDNSMSPTQQNQDIKNRARELANTDPSLGQHIQFDDKGNFSIGPNATLGDRAVIASRIYGQNKKDIALPSDNPKDTKKKTDTKTDTKKAPDSKYQVSVTD